LVLFGSALPAVAFAGTVAVTTGTQYQVIQGFGASSYSESISTAEATSFFTDQSNAALGSQNGNSIGLSILRLSIDESGNFGTEGNDAKASVAINPNLEVFASSWSPPAADKACNCVNGPGSGQAANTNTNFAPAAGSTNVPSNLPAFATYQAGFAQTMKNTYGVDLYAISPQNEPDWNTTYDSCLWTPAQFDTYVPLLSNALKNVGMGSVKIMMPESFSDNLAGSATTMADSNAAPLVSIVGMHLYGGGPNAIPASYSTVAGHAIQGWVTEISEHSSSGTPFSDTMYYAQQVHKCIVDTGFNAYCYWWLVNLNSDDEGLYTSGAAPTSTYYMMGNWAKFIRPGYMRVSCTENPATNVQVSAYTGTATEGGSSVNRVVIVAINSSGSSVSQTFNYADQTVTQAYPWITSASQNFVAQAVQAVSGNQFTYTLPANSITTFVADCGSQGSPTPSVSPTPTRTRSATPSVSPTSTPTASGTATASPTATPSGTRSVTSSATPTLSRTASASPSLTATLAAPTATLTRTGTPSATMAVSSATATPSATVAVSSATATPGATVAVSSATATPSATVAVSSATATPSATVAVSSATATPSATVAVSSATATPSATVAVSSATATPSATVAVSSATASPSASPPTTASMTPTQTPSVTAAVSSATESVTPTQTPSATIAISSATATPSRSTTPSATLTATSSPMVAASPTPSEAATAPPTARPLGPLAVLRALPLPDPNPVAVGVLLAGDADGATLRVWSVAYKLVAQESVGPMSAGWSRLALPPGFLQGAANGAYYLTITVRRGAAQAGSGPVKLLLIR